MMGRRPDTEPKPPVKTRNSRKRFRDVDEITDIAAEEAFDGALTESIRARWVFWQQLGDLAPELIAPQVNAMPPSSTPIILDACKKKTPIFLWPCSGPTRARAGCM